MRIELGGSDWADIKDPDALRSADRRAVNKVTKMFIDPETEMPVLSAELEAERTYALATQVITNWSLPLPLPSADPKSLDKLTLVQDSSLFKGLKPYLDLIDGRENPAEKDTDPTEGSSS